MADLSTLQSRLTEAETALHKLNTGRLSVTFQHGDMQVTYNKADAPQLREYIADLRVQIAAAGGASVPRRRALIIES